MKTILIYPAYFPSILQMAAVVQADKVIFEVADNYQKQTYRNRAYIAHSNGKLLLNVPIKHSKEKNYQKTQNVLTEKDFPWQLQHLKSLQSAYRTSPFFEYYEDELAPLFSEPAENLLTHNLKTFEIITEILGIDKEIEQTTTFEKSVEEKDFRFLINAKLKPTVSFEKYHQVHQANHEFLPNLSILDLLFNEGPNALSYLESQELPSL